MEKLYFSGLVLRQRSIDKTTSGALLWWRPQPRLWVGNNFYKVYIKRVLENTLEIINYFVCCYFVLYLYSIF